MARRRLLPCAPAAGSPDELGELDPHRVGDADQRVQKRRGVPLLDPAVRGDVDPGPAAHVRLSEVEVLAYSADLLAHLAAAGKDPLVGWGGTWHSSTMVTP